MIAELQETNWKDKFLANKNADVCVLWNIFKAKIHQLREKFVPTSSNEVPFWKLKGSVPVSIEVRKLIREKGRLHRAWVRSHNANELSRRWHNLTMVSNYKDMLELQFKKMNFATMLSVKRANRRG